MENMVNRSLTAVPGIRAGHALVRGGGSGCTVVLGPFRGACAIRGMATGTRELPTLEPDHLVPQADAILLTGGSAFGLAAADGVMAWLKERGAGFPTPGGAVPIVPAAVIYDLQEGVPVPSPEQGRAACAAATEAPLPEGRVGAGAGARVGAALGREAGEPGGVGGWAIPHRDGVVAALSVVNAFGDVLDASGRIIAGARRPDGHPVDTAGLLISGDEEPMHPLRNTTLTVVATSMPVSRLALHSLARMAADGITRAVRPAGTPFDGDVVFAIAPGREEAPITPGSLAALGAAAAEAVAISIRRAVRREEEVQ